MSWDEVGRLRCKGDPAAFLFSPDEAIRRCERLGDLFEPVLKLRQRLPGVAKRRPAKAA
jgi:hypothetical protein